jgi:hypothetical protein
MPKSMRFRRSMYLGCVSGRAGSGRQTRRLSILSRLASFHFSTTAPEHPSQRRYHHTSYAEPIYGGKRHTARSHLARTRRRAFRFYRSLHLRCTPGRAASGEQTRGQTLPAGRHHLALQRQPLKCQSSLDFHAPHTRNRSSRSWSSPIPPFSTAQARAGRLAATITYHFTELAVSGVEAQDPNLGRVALQHI